MKKKLKFKSKIQEISTFILLSLIAIVLGATFFFPLILSSITGNWRFLLLFCVSWIPVIFEIIVLKIIFSPKELWN